VSEPTSSRLPLQETSLSTNTVARQAPHRFELGGRVPHPGGERRAVDDNSLTGQHLRLAVERHVVAILRQRHVRHHPLGRQAALDQPGLPLRLHHGARAGPATVFRAAGDDDLVACRDHIEALKPVLADVHRTLAARAHRRFRLNHHLDPRQVIRPSAAALPPLSPRAWRTP
jgi:hypothetical protein